MRCGQQECQCRGKSYRTIKLSDTTSDNAKIALYETLRGNLRGNLRGYSELPLPREGWGLDLLGR